ncbi:histidine-rich glycoprotein-like [Photinus pyralis]|uniref:histidine-rich glycoprotein-like n=1 Tax=Photinus pyralis TaxID=7054 RepID=UPI0012677854|nr:histidine-rich glycoprotein-like [Photinus pyralis]
MYKLFVLSAALLAVVSAEPEAKPDVSSVHGVQPVAPFTYGHHPHGDVLKHYSTYHHDAGKYGAYHPYDKFAAYHPHGDALKHYSTYHHDAAKYGAYNPYDKFSAYHHPSQYYGAHHYSHGLHGYPAHHEAYTAGYPYHAGAFHHYNNPLVHHKY